MKCYQPEVYFISEIEDKNKEEFVKVTIAGVNCNALIDTGTTRSCISETLYNHLMLPWVLSFLYCGNFCLW